VAKLDSVAAPLTYTVPAGTDPHTLVLRLHGANLELIDNGTLVASPPLGATNYVHVIGADNQSDSLTVDNNFGGLVAVTSGIRFDGGAGGTNTLNLVGAPKVGTLNLTPTFATIDAFQAVTFTNVATATAFGILTGSLFGGSGDSTFTATPANALLSGPGYNLAVSGYGTVRAYAGPGGNASAYLYDPSGSDLFMSHPDHAFLQGIGQAQVASGFGSVRASVSGGNNTAYLYDSTGNDLFLATPTYAYLTGPGYIDLVTGFRRVSAFSSGGNDFAALFESAGDDYFQATPAYAFLTGSGYINGAMGFYQVAAYGGAGGNDTAQLFDSPGDDVFQGQGPSGVLYGSGYVRSTDHVGHVVAGSTLGGTDRLFLGALDYVFEAVGNWQ
jgi:hypothetical protein